MKPFSPSDVTERQIQELPEIVIEAINNILVRKVVSGYARFDQNEAIDEITKLQPEISRHHIFEHRWLDFEPHYRKNGWKVEFDKPAYCESYTAYWVFRKSN